MISNFSPTEGVTFFSIGMDITIEDKVYHGNSYATAITSCLVASDFLDYGELFYGYDVEKIERIRSQLVTLNLVKTV